MTGQTDRFRFTTLDKATDRVDDDDWKFGDSDRAALDRLLGYAVERHRHDGSVTPNDDLAAPMLTVSTSGGVLPAGATVYYRYVVVDALGHESAPSAMGVVHLPQVVATPTAPSLVVGPAEVSYFTAGLYQYAISAVSDDSNLYAHQTLLSPTVVAEVVVGQVVTLTLPPLPSGAMSGFNLYRKGPMEAALHYIGPIAGGEIGEPLIYVDEGLDFGNPHRLAPVTNTTYSTNSVQVATPAGLPEGSNLKFYRTFTPANWESSLISWGGDVIIDTGHLAQVGSPSIVRENVDGAPKIELGVDTEGALPPGVLAIPFEARFERDGPVTEGVGPYVWVCDFDYAEITSARAWLARGSVPDAVAVITTLEVQRAGVGDWIEVFGAALQNVRYPSGEAARVAGTVDILDDTLRILMVDDGYQYSSTDVFLSDVPVAARGVAETLINKSLDGFGFSATPEPEVAPAGKTITSFVLYQDTGVETSSHLLAHIRRQFNGDPISFVTANGPVTLTFPEYLYVYAEPGT